MEEAFQTLLDFMIEQSYNINGNTEISWKINADGFLLGTFYIDGEKNMVAFYPEINTFRDGRGDISYDEEIAEAVDTMIDGILKAMVKALGIRISDESLAAERED